MQFSYNSGIGNLKSLGDLATSLEPLLAMNGENEEQMPQVVIKGKVPGNEWSVSIEPILDVDYTPTNSFIEQQSRTYGYTLSPDEYGYMDVQVMRVKDTIDVFLQNS